MRCSSNLLIPALHPDFYSFVYLGRWLQAPGLGFRGGEQAANAHALPSRILNDSLFQAQHWLGYLLSKVARSSVPWVIYALGDFPPAMRAGFWPIEEPPRYQKADNGIIFLDWRPSYCPKRANFQWSWAAFALREKRRHYAGKKWLDQEAGAMKSNYSLP